MEHLTASVLSGLGHVEWAQAALRIAIGVFFTISGYHKLFNKSRHAQMVTTLQDCGVRWISMMQWFVPSVEFLGGASLVLGLIAPLGALGLIVICAVATCTDGIRRVVRFQPIDRADYIGDVLYLPEVLYIFALFLVIASGSGPFSLDAAIIHYVL
jgi:putative oxidoreductase